MTEPTPLHITNYTPHHTYPGGFHWANENCQNPHIKEKDLALQYQITIPESPPITLLILYTPKNDTHHLITGGNQRTLTSVRLATIPIWHNGPINPSPVPTHTRIAISKIHTHFKQHGPP